MMMSSTHEYDLWQVIRQDANELMTQAPELSAWLNDSVLAHNDFASALAQLLSNKLSNDMVVQPDLNALFVNVLSSEPELIEAALIDLSACFERDPACEYHLMPLLYFKGYQSIQAQRLAHHAWHSKKTSLAYFIQSQMSVCFGVDMHPAVQLGKGIMLDHATGVVMGETTIVGNNVSILHGVTLGGCGISDGVRHPNIGDGVLISAGAKILGAVSVGEGAKIAAGSLVLEDVPEHSTVAGVPARIVGKPKSDLPATEMDQSLEG
ncbi:MAG: serine O-acetyltransferase [Pseudomonadota bacterium]